MNHQVNLNKEEEQYYYSCWLTLNPSGGPSIEGRASVMFFKKSGLPTDKLKQIWLMAATDSSTLLKEEFYVALRLIAYAQSGYDLTEQLLIEQRPVQLPKIDGIPMQSMPNQMSMQSPIYQQPQPQPQPQPQQSPIQPSLSGGTQFDLPADQYAKYETYYHTQDKSNQGFISGVDARSLFEKSQLSKPTLLQIWALVDHNTKGYLVKQEFIIAIHLISVCRKGELPPQVLPESLQKYMRNIDQPPQRASSMSMMQPDIPKPMANSYMTQPSITQSINSMGSTQSEFIGLNNQNNALQQKLLTQVSQIQTATTLDQDVIAQSKKNIEFLDTTIQKLQSILQSINLERDQLKQQIKQQNEEQLSKQQQVNTLQQNIQDGLQQNQQLKQQQQSMNPQQYQQQQPQQQYHQQPPQNTQQPFPQNPQSQQAPQQNRIQSGPNYGQPGNNTQPPQQQYNPNESYGQYLGPPLQQQQQTYNQPDYNAQQQPQPQSQSQPQPQQPQSQQNYYGNAPIAQHDDGFDYEAYKQKRDHKISSQNSQPEDHPW